MYLITAYFDDNTTKTLQEYIDRIAENTGNTFMVDNNVPPHMTICALEARGVDVLEENFSSLEGKLKSGSINIVSLGQFLPYVFFAAPIKDDYLRGLSQDIYEAMSDIDEVSVNKYYMPNLWVPHVTLGKKLTNEQMKKSLEAVKDFTPIAGKIVRLGLSTVNPHIDVKKIDL